MSTDTNNNRKTEQTKQEKSAKRLIIPEKWKNVNIYKILTIVLAGILLVMIAVLLHSWLVVHRAAKTYEELASQVNRIQNVGVNYLGQDDSQEEIPTETAAEEQSDAEGLIPSIEVEVPVKNLDWDALEQINPDIYAWIYIPGTKVDYPVVQHESDDEYYLDHNLDGSRGYPSCIYSQSINAKDFSDFNTIIYGHNMRDKTMFSTLHEFENQNFFNNSCYIFVYTRYQVLAYQIFAAYTSDDQNIIMMNDFSDVDVRQSYLDNILKVGGFHGRIRSAYVGTNSHLLTLSTCISGADKERYLVQAVLLNEDALPQ